MLQQELSLGNTAKYIELIYGCSECSPKNCHLGIHQNMLNRSRVVQMLQQELSLCNTAIYVKLIEGCSECFSKNYHFGIQQDMLN